MSGMDLSIAELQIIKRSLNVRLTELVKYVMQSPGESNPYQEELLAISVLLGRIIEEQELHDRNTKT